MGNAKDEDVETRNINIGQTESVKWIRNSVPETSEFKRPEPIAPSANEDRDNEG